MEEKQLNIECPDMGKSCLYLDIYLNIFITVIVVLENMLIPATHSA